MKEFREQLLDIHIYEEFVQDSKHDLGRSYLFSPEKFWRDFLKTAVLFSEHVWSKFTYIGLNKS